MLCDPIWHVSSRSGEASRELLYSVYFTLLYYVPGDGTLGCREIRRTSQLSDSRSVESCHTVLINRMNSLCNNSACDMQMKWRWGHRQCATQKREQKNLWRGFSSRIDIFCCNCDVFQCEYSVRIGSSCCKMLFVYRIAVKRNNTLCTCIHILL